MRLPNTFHPRPSDISVATDSIHPLMSGKWLCKPFVVRLAPEGWKKEHLDPPDTEQTLTEEYLDCSASSKESIASWVRLIARVYEVDPLECPTCHSEMRILAFIIDPQEVRKILKHLVKIGKPPPGLNPASLN